MILKEELIEKEAIEIEKKILKTLKKAGKLDIEYKTMGSMDITSFFENYKKIIEEKNIKINFNYNFDYDKPEIKATTLKEEEKEIILYLFGKKEKVMPSLYHEITHIIDLLKANLKTKNLRKSYKKISSDAKEGKPMNKEFISAFYSNTLEFNTLINTIAKNYKTNKKYKKAFDAVKNYEELLNIIFYNKEIEINKYALNDINFKKKLYHRLIKENIIPGYLKKKISFRQKVKSFFI